MSLVLRQVKGSKLSIQEMDNNLIYLQNLALSGISSGGTTNPAGNNKQIQFNDGGVFGASTGFTFDKNTNHVNLHGSLSATNLVTGYIYSNPKNIEGVIDIPDNHNAIIIGPDSSIDPGADITIGVNSDLTIFNPNYEFTGNTSGDQISNLWLSGNVHANYYYGDGSNLTGINSSVSAIEITYNDLVNNIINSGLTAGTAYVITDYRTCYDQPDYDNLKTPIFTGNYKQGPVEPIFVFATSNNTLSTDAYQPNYPFDKIKYDWSFTSTTTTNGSAKGRIIKRIDNLNNRTDYDHRNILFKRYKFYSYDVSTPLTGLISISGNNLLGFSALFTSELSIGSVITVPILTPSEFVVTNILDDNTATISGETISDVTDVLFYLSVDQGYISYYQNNIDSNDFIEYTTFGDAIIFQTAFDNFIDDYSNGHLELGYGDFLLANNVFKSGLAKENKFGHFCYNNTFASDCANNHIDDSFYNNLIPATFSNNNITNNFYDNIIIETFENNHISNGFNSNYLIGGSFLQNHIQSFFYDNFHTSNIFRDNNIANDFYNNKIYNEFYDNHLGNEIFNNLITTSFYSNLIIDNFNNNYIYSNFFENHISNLFNNNTLGSPGSIGTTDFGCNVIGDSFNNNDVIYDFRDNHVQNDFEQNSINYNFRKNNIFNNFRLNTISGGTFEENFIQNDFINNQMLGSFSHNNIACGFTGNTLDHHFAHNQISNFFIDNITAENFQYNFTQTELSAVNFTTYYKSISAFTFSATGSSAVDSTYSNLTGSTNGLGSNASFDVMVSGNSVTSVVLNSIGRYYEIGDTITIEGSNIGGTSSDDIIITVDVLNLLPSVYQIYTCNIFKNAGGNYRLSYYDELDVLTIQNTDE